jgi:hypothetical protein
MGVVSAYAADLPKGSPFGQAGATATPATPGDLEFAGVSTVGKKTMINLYNKQSKESFWVEAGTTKNGVTVVKYDSPHDQVTIRQNGVEKLLPLRAPSAVVSGPTAPVSALAPAQTEPAPAPSTPGAAAPTTTSTTSLSQARQEEEARMLVSDLLEIGMAQRRAYEEARRKAAAGQTGQPAQQPAAAQDQGTAPAAAQPAPQPAEGTPPSPPSGG